MVLEELHRGTILVLIKDQSQVGGVGKNLGNTGKHRKCSRLIRLRVRIDTDSNWQSALLLVPPSINQPGMLAKRLQLQQVDSVRQ